MSSYIETGHANIVANFADLVERVSTMPMTYDPGLPDLQLPALNSVVAQSEASILEVTDLNSFLAESINQRQILFKELPLYATRVINVMAYCNASRELLKDARAANRKLRGERAGDTKLIEMPTDGGTSTEPTPDLKRISASQQSFDQRAIQFAKIAGYVQAMPGYFANEADMSLSGVIAHRDLLLSTNKDVSTYASNLFNARVNRNKLLYGKSNGIYYLAIRVKWYVRSVLGQNDPMYKEIARIPFKKPR